VTSRTVVVSAAVAVFVVCSSLPIAYLLTVSLTRPGGFTALFLDGRQRGLLLNTALLGTGAAVMATAVGVPLGFALARRTMARKTFLRLALAAPVVLPPYVVGLAWTYVGASGAWPAALFGADRVSDWIYSLPAAIVVLGLVFYPISMLATEVALRRIDGRLEEAALMIAPPRRVLWRVTLPLAAPAILAAALMIFVLAVSEFGVPALLRVRVYTTEVFTAFAALYDFTRAVVIAMPLLLLCAIVAAAATRLAGNRLLVARRSAGTPPALLGGWAMSSIVFALAVLVAALAIPLTVLVGEAVGLRSVEVTLHGSTRAIVNSLILAAVGATAIVSVAVWLGYGRSRARARMGQLADVVFVVAFAVPSTIVGIGLIGLWNRPGPIGAVYGTNVMLLFGYLARFLPVAALALAASARAVPVSHEEAAAVSGAGWFRTMARIVLPQMRLGLAAAWTIAFVFSFGEIGVSILVSPPGETTLPIRIYTIIANAPASQVAALALLQSIVCLAPLAAVGAALSVKDAR
jgi:iron(III) transport system permease protein